MKQFIKIVIASTIGSFIAVGLLFFVMVSSFMALTMASISPSSHLGMQIKSQKIKDSSVLRLTLHGALEDRMSFSNFFQINPKKPLALGLYEITRVLKKAAKDNRIKGILIEFEDLRSGMANIEALRRQIVRFKESGKFVLAYGESYGELDYIVASAADEVILYPKGEFEWNGLAAKIMYFKNTFGKLEIIPQEFRVGRYKSVAEPFTSEKMSKESREQTDAILKTWWQQMLSYAKDKTKLSVDELNLLANDMSVLYPEQAKAHGFVDVLSSIEGVNKKVLELTGVKEKPRYVDWKSFYRTEVKSVGKAQDTKAKKKLAIVFAKGAISKQSDVHKEGIGSDPFLKMFNKIRQDKDIKAVVLRVNSPGGDALASDVIWNSIEFLKKQKPVVTSFGNVAASGGYYISAGSQYIFAEPTTITGSIGVIGLLFITKKFFNNKLGVTLDTTKTHRFADFAPHLVQRPFDTEEKAKVKDYVGRIYGDFLNVVTQGRPSLKTNEQTHELAQGRVWVGADAKDRGLVDELGGLEAAISKAAELADLGDQYQVEVYPKKRGAFEELLFQISGLSSKIVSRFLPDVFKSLLTKKKTKLHKNIQTRIPFDLEIH